MTTETIPLYAIEPPQVNPRSAINAAALEGLAASIRQDGLLQNLVVTRAKGGRYRIVSGERRYRALRLLAERGEIEKDYGVRVEIRGRLGKGEALRLATVENVQRENLTPLDEAAAFAALLRKGAALDELAARTGLSQATIRRRLVLNDLCAAAKDALAAGKIGRGYGPYSAEDIRERLLDDRPSVAMAIFPVERYTGTITTDLFAGSETSYFDDAAQFLALQREAVAALAESYAGRAAWFEITESYRIPDWQYEQAGDGEEGGVLINLAPSGRVEVREGLARPAMEAATREAVARSPLAPAKPKPAYSMPLRRYIAWHKTLAVQALLLADPRRAREVAVMERLTHLVPHEALQQLAREESPGSAHATLAAQARLCAGWLGIAVDEERPVWEQIPPRHGDTLALYEAVRALSDEHLEALHTLLSALAFGQALCERLDTGDSLFNRVARDLGTDMRRHWRPGRAFFERRSREQLLGIARECDCADLHDLGRLRTYKNAELTGCLLRHFTGAEEAAEPNAAQRKALEWLPGAMLFPAVDPDAPGDEEIDEEAPADEEPEEEQPFDQAA